MSWMSKIDLPGATSLHVISLFFMGDMLNDLHPGGFLFACVCFLLVGWFVSCVAQKLLNGFPRN